MGFSAPAKLFFVAAALFLGVVALGLVNDGFEPKAVIGTAMAGALIRVGWNIRARG